MKRHPRRSKDKPTEGKTGHGPKLTEPMRLNRYIALAGVCARRKADDMIASGQVQINGKFVKELGTKVQPDDVVKVGGKTISPRAYIYILMNKPTDTITTVDDEKDRRTVLDLIDLKEAEQAKVFPVGRLDRNTQGALLLTNDGELAHRLMHPSYEVEKIYRVSVRDPLTDDDLEKLYTGVELEDGIAKADRVQFIGLPDTRHIAMSIHQGKNRQVRRMIEALGNEVEKLERVQYATLDLKGIRRGKWRRLFEREVKKLRRSVRLK